jgi:hypothetical protein
MRGVIFPLTFDSLNTFALTIFLGAFLLFQIQPLIAKYVLPWFGGGPGVWTICMLFFQAMLLAGYAYAHATSSHLRRRTQAVLHILLLLLALAFLPIVPGAHWKPEPGADPTWRILLLLTACLGLPYFVLAATGPLLQSWFHTLYPLKVPYRFYALSNAGSLLALVSYPFVFEPNVTRSLQARLWAWSFGGFVVLCGACAWQLLKVQPKVKPKRRKPPKIRAQSPRVHSSQVQSSTEEAPTAGNKAWWFGLSACASIMLLAVTNKLCLDMASVPFLWVLPLSLYLLTFVICFDRPAWYVRKWCVLLFFPPFALACYTLYRGYDASFWQQLIGFSGALFFGCMICHGEVYRLRPPARHLTAFYLFVAAGGAAGGVFVGVISPLVFHSFAELNWGFWLLAVLVSGILIREKSAVRFRNRSWKLWPVLVTGLLVLSGALLFQARRAGEGVILVNRNFYGVLRIVELSPGTKLQAHQLFHGNIIHGLQFTSPPMSTLATTYYNDFSGVGLTLNNFPRQTNRSVGVVGLGIGTLAAYGRSGDRFRFYEIDPEVRWLAENKYSYLKDSKAHIEMVSGDARLSLESEPAQQFDVLVLDAFGSDAIPVHLLTQEAFETYFRHTKEDGAIAILISNRHLNLLPVLVGIAKNFRRLVICVVWDDKSRPPWFASSIWVVLSRNRPFIYSPPIFSHGTRIPSDYAEHPVIWTDDYASLLPIIRY